MSQFHPNLISSKVQLAKFFSKCRDYALLYKPNLSTMVVFSSIIGYLMAPGVSFDFVNVFLLYIGGFMVTGGANTINQILEKDGDKMMKRTMSRPLPGDRMSVKEAWFFATISGVGGALILGYNFNILAGVFSFVSLLLYAFAYTPMKRVHPIAVLIGAIPGAMPPLLGWVAATNDLWTAMSIGGWVLFSIQFFWQFPHYWAIGWVAFDEYKKAGINMLPTRERTSKFTASLCMLYSAILIPFAVVPYYLKMCNQWGMWFMMTIGVYYFIMNVVFYFKNDFPSAKKVMYASFIYLPVALLALYFTKI